MPSKPQASMFETSSFMASPAQESPQLSIQTNMAQPSRHSLPLDVPELCFEPGYSATPSSAASSSSIPTPLCKWDAPLPNASPQIMVAAESFLFTADDWQWPLPQDDFYPSMTDCYPPHDLSHSPCSRDPAEWMEMEMEDLDWEKQLEFPDFSPPLNDNHNLFSSHDRGDQTSRQASFQHTATSHPFLAFQDTHRNQLCSSSPVSSGSSSTASPFAHFSSSPAPTVSPSKLMLSSSDMPSSSSSYVLPSILDPSSPTPQPLLKLHAPRPRRDIPIISLDRLAAASDEVLRMAPSKGSFHPRPPQSASLTPHLINQGRAATDYRGNSQPFTTTLPHYPSLHTTSNATAYSSHHIISCQCGCSGFAAPMSRLHWS